MSVDGKAVRVRGLRKSYRGKVAVDGIDLDIDHGECFALLGPNGAGKTTTVEILEGHRVKDAGEVHIGASKAEIGIVLQEANDAGDLTVREMVSHFAGYYRDPREPMELIEFVGLPAANTDPHALRRAAAPPRCGTRFGRAAPSCCSLTSRRPGSIRRPAASSGT